MDPPPQKRPKKSEDNEMENQNIGKLDAAYFMVQLKPVLHETETRPAELVSVYISEVPDLKIVSKLIAYLSLRCPLESLMHLKRIRKVPTEDPKVWRTEVLIGLVSALSSESETHIALLNTYGLTLRTYQVPRFEPLMKAQYENWTKLWPITLKAHIPSTPDPREAFSPEIVEKFVSCMRKLFPLAAKAGNACTILDASANELATSSTSPDTALSHCCMNAINLVAENQLKSSSDVHFTHHKRDASGPSSVTKPLDYLCTGCTVILVQEPCIMCSMALLHSRVACVIYAISNHSAGGLGSRFSVHCEPRLNHHFHVYRGFLQEEVVGVSD